MKLGKKVGRRKDSMMGCASSRKCRPSAMRAQGAMFALPLQSETDMSATPSRPCSIQQRHGFLGLGGQSRLLLCAGGEHGSPAPASRPKDHWPNTVEANGRMQPLPRASNDQEAMCPQPHSTTMRLHPPDGHGQDPPLSPREHVRQGGESSAQPGLALRCTTSMNSSN